MNEGQPISIIEAMAYKNAIITTKYRSIPDLISEKKNVFVKKRSQFYCQGVKLFEFK